MIEELKRNIEIEIGMLREISNYSRKSENSPSVEKKLLESAVDSLLESMKIINSSIPALLNEIPTTQKLTSIAKISNLEKVSFKRDNKQDLQLVVKREDRDKLLTELSINEQLIRKLRKKTLINSEYSEEFKSARGYLKLSNRVFLDLAEILIKKGYFDKLSREIKKANIEMLFEAYVAMVLFTTLVSIFVSIGIGAVLFMFKIDFGTLAFSLYNGEYIKRILLALGSIILIPIATFFSLYYYPSTEKISNARRIDQELPFAVIHMSAISGSGIEPTEIFKIIVLSKEYPYLRREIRKVLNQINLYGYDLVASLDTVAKSTPSAKLAELFSGLSTTINSGGSLNEFFDKRSESLLLSYRLEREKFTSVAETFMDIYISVVIAAPMILMLLLIMLSVSNFSAGFSTGQMTFIIISIIAVVNVVFLAFLQIKQPSY